MRGTGGGLEPVPNPRAVVGSGEFANFHSSWAKMQCHLCQKFGHISMVCPTRNDNGRRAFDRKFLAWRGLPEVEALGQAMLVTTKDLVLGMTEIDEAEYDRLLMCMESSTSAELDEKCFCMLAREEVGSEGWLAGVPRCVPTGPTAVIDSGCSIPMVSATFVKRSRGQGVPMEFLKCADVRRIETGKGVIGLQAAVRFLVRMPVWGEDAAGRPKRLGHMPIPVLALVNPLLPIDFLWGNTLALEYMATWTPWNGRYWLDCPMLRQRVFIQLAYTTHLSVVAPLVFYEDTADSQRTLSEEWMGRGSTGHVFSFPLFDKARWTDVAYRLRYERSRVPSLAGSYARRHEDTEPRDGFAYGANGSGKGVWLTVKHRVKARSGAGGPKGLGLSNSFAALALPPIAEEQGMDARMTDVAGPSEMGKEAPAAH